MFQVLPYTHKLSEFLINFTYFVLKDSGAYELKDDRALFPH